MTKLRVAFRSFAKATKTARVKKALITHHVTEDYGDTEMFSTHTHTHTHTHT